MAERSVYEFVRARTDAMQATRYNYESTWQNIADNLFGRRDFSVKQRTPGQNRKARIYDDTASQMLDLLAGGIHSLVVNPAKRSFGLRFENADLNDSQAASLWLSAVEDRIDLAISSPRANFHSQIAETFVDLVGFGTGGLFIDDKPGEGVLFSNRPLQELFLVEDAAGRVNGVARFFRLTAENASSIFGDKARAANRAIAQNAFDVEHEYRHLIMPNENQQLGKFDVSGMEFSSVIISCEDQSVMSEGGYHEMPLVTPRWTKEPGEVYGRGGGHNALSNGAGLNEQKKTAYMAGQLAVAPPRMVDGESVLPSDISFAPHALIVVDTTTTQMNPPIQSLASTARFDVSERLLSMDQDSVRAAFHWPLLQSLQDARMTATQVLELSAQMQRHLAPILGRLQNELLDPIINRVFAIESRAGRLPPPPPEVLEGGEEIKIDYESSIFKAQKTSAARSVIDFSSAAANLSQVAPDVLDVVDFDAGIRELAEAMGVPPSMLKSQDSVERARAARRELAAQEAARQQSAAEIDNIAKLNKSQPAQPVA